MANAELLEQTMAAIYADPDAHKQDSFISACGTEMCFAGHALIQSGRYRVSSNENDTACFRDNETDEVVQASSTAARLLDLDWEEEDYLFYFFGDRDELHLRVKDPVIER